MTVRPRQKAGSIVALVLGAALLPGCTVDSQPYYTVTSGMAPADRGEFEVHSLYFADEVPLRYVLETERYSLIAEIDPELLNPSLLFSVLSKTLPNAVISGESPSHCFGQFMSPMYKYPNLKDARHIVHFYGIHIPSPDCRNDAYVGNGQATVIVTVASDDGTVAGVHEITVGLESTGIRVNFDGP